MAEATNVQAAQVINFTPTAAVVAGQVIQLPDGRAGVAQDAVAAGALGAFQVSGIAYVAKTTTMVMLPGSELFWDASADAAHLLFGNDKDFYLGVCTADAASAATGVYVNLNQRPTPTVSFAHGFVSVPINTAGFPFVGGSGDAVIMGFSATAEAQKVDALSVRKMAVSAKGVANFLLCLNTNSDNAAGDLNIGLANATHATDADSITEHVFFHMDGAALTINVQSKDGGTTNTAATTTLSAVVGTPVLFQLDFRDNTDIKAYINGVRVMDGTTGASKTLKTNSATGPLGLMVHWEKTSDDSPGNLTCRAFATTFDAGTP